MAGIRQGPLRGGIVPDLEQTPLFAGFLAGCRDSADGVWGVDRLPLAN